MNPLIANLSESLFWDTDRQNLEPKRHSAYIIERVLSRGTWQDFLLIREFYGKASIKRAVKKLRYLDSRVLHFCSIYFQIPLTNFRCYSIQQSNLTHWNY